MRKHPHCLTSALAGIIMFLLILDVKTVLQGAAEGVDICIYTIIPSLFPFFVLSIIINSSLAESNFRFLKPIGKLCGIPTGCEYLLLLGLVGGYPVGAQSIAQAYENRQLRKDDALRMLGFCNNAGPAFLFGMAGSLFSRAYIPWILWLIQIISALLTGILLPRKNQYSGRSARNLTITLPQALERSLRILGSICGWVILFKVVITILNRWILWFFPPYLQIFIAGLLELSNGCYALSSIASEPVRFLLSSVFLSFGGICVGMQTRSITNKLGVGMYFPGKILQTILVASLSYFAQLLIFPHTESIRLSYWFVILPLTFVLLSIIYFCYPKKEVAILEKL